MTAIQTIPEAELSVGGSRESHIPRDVDERPLVGLCGYVRRSMLPSRSADPGEHATCVVCREMWDAGIWS